MTTNRISLIVAAFVIAALAVLTISSMAASRTPNGSNSILPSYDQLERERASRYQAAAAEQAYMDQRHGEQTAGNAVQGGHPIGGYRPADDSVGDQRSAEAQLIGGFRPADDFLGAPQASVQNPVDRSFHTPQASEYTPLGAFHTPQTSEYQP